MTSAKDYFCLQETQTIDQNCVALDEDSERRAKKRQHVVLDSLLEDVFNVRFVGTLVIHLFIDTIHLFYVYVYECL